MRFKLRTIPWKMINGYVPNKGPYKQLKLFGKVFFQYSKFNGKARIKFFPHRKNPSLVHEYKNAMFFKVNRISEYSLACIHRWMDIAEAMNSLVIIICDNPELEKQIFKHTWFKDPNIRVVTSKRSIYSSFISNIASKSWKNAACAHLTAFYYARQFGVSKFWSIDADDTMFLCESTKVVELLIKAMNYAENENINLFSLDMWKSRTFGKHWSWGITYVRDKDNLYEQLTQEKNAKWTDDYKDCFEPQNTNSDWHINSLVKRGFNIRIGTFYPNETGFIHWGAHVFNPVGSYICKWKDGYISYPIMEALGVKELSRVPIHYECVCFDIGVAQDEMRDCYLNNATWLKWSSDVVAKFYGLDKIKGLKFER